MLHEHPRIKLICKDISYIEIELVLLMANFHGEIFV